MDSGAIAQGLGAPADVASEAYYRWFWAQSWAQPTSWAPERGEATGIASPPDGVYAPSWRPPVPALQVGDVVDGLRVVETAGGLGFTAAPALTPADIAAAAAQVAAGAAGVAPTFVGEGAAVLQAAASTARLTAAAQAAGVAPDVYAAGQGEVTSALSVLPAAPLAFGSPRPMAWGSPVPQLHATGATAAVGDVQLAGGPSRVDTGAGQAGTSSAGLSVTLGTWEWALVLFVLLELFANWPIAIRRRG